MAQRRHSHDSMIATISRPRSVDASLTNGYTDEVVMSTMDIHDYGIYLCVSDPQCFRRWMPSTISLTEHAMVSTLGCHASTQSPSSLPSQKPTPYKMRLVFCKLVHAVRVRSALPGLNHDSFTAKPSSHHVHVTPPTSPCPTLSVNAEPERKCAETIFCVQCAVWCNQK